MLDTVIDQLAKQFRIDHGLARQAIAMVIQALHENGAGHLVSELEAAIDGLGDVEAAGSGGGGRGLMGEASGLLGGTSNSGLHGLDALLGHEKLNGFDEALSKIVSEHANEDLGSRLKTELDKLTS